mgnify:CR=1 FL=1
MLPVIIFYFFAAILVFSALMVITARNPVHSVLFLILAFFTAAGLFVLLGAEFLAMILTIVYVGAVAVLFLFVVMMLDINFQDLRKGALEYVPIGVTIGVILLLELFFLFQNWEFAKEAAAESEVPAPDGVTMTNAEGLGAVLYTDYFLIFQISGLILLVAMIGAIVLTLRSRLGVRRQKVAEQFARRPKDVLEVKRVSPGTGVQ